MKFAIRESKIIEIDLEFTRGDLLVLRCNKSVGRGVFRVNPLEKIGVLRFFSRWFEASVLYEKNCRHQSKRWGW
ncbi:MAG: hypothetical protein RLZZ396_650 [Planctomycetota bacterium]|jgi:hypothetical protein